MAGQVQFLYAGWEPLARIVFVGTCAYFALLFTLRVPGPRSIAKTNIFDFIVSVAIGSVFGRILTAKEVALTEACLAFALLVGLQWLVSRLRLRWPWFASLVANGPVLLFYEGQYLAPALSRARFSPADVDELLRTKGYGSRAGVRAVVLEASGEISVLRREESAGELIPRPR